MEGERERERSRPNLVKEAALRRLFEQPEAREGDAAGQGGGESIGDERVPVEHGGGGGRGRIPAGRRRRPGGGGGRGGSEGAVAGSGEAEGRDRGEDGEEMRAGRSEGWVGGGGKFDGSSSRHSPSSLPNSGMDEAEVVGLVDF